MLAAKKHKFKIHIIGTTAFKSLGWLHFTVVEHWSVTGELSCPTLDLQLMGDPFMWVNRPLQDQPTGPTQPFILSRSVND